MNVALINPIVGTEQSSKINEAMFCLISELCKVSYRYTLITPTLSTLSSTSSANLAASNLEWLQSLTNRWDGVKIIPVLQQKQIDVAHFLLTPSQRLSVWTQTHLLSLASYFFSQSIPITVSFVGPTPNKRWKKSPLFTFLAEMASRITFEDDANFENNLNAFVARFPETKNKIKKLTLLTKPKNNMQCTRYHLLVSGSTIRYGSITKLALQLKQYECGIGYRPSITILSDKISRLQQLKLQRAFDYSQLPISWQRVSKSKTSDVWLSQNQSVIVPLKDQHFTESEINSAVQWAWQDLQPVVISQSMQQTSWRSAANTIVLPDNNHHYFRRLSEFSLTDSTLNNSTDQLVNLISRFYKEMR